MPRDHTQTFFFGDTACDRLKLMLTRDAPVRILAVLDHQAYVQSGADRLLEKLFAQNATIRFTDFEPNPKIDDVRRGIDVFLAARPEVIVAVGGGTAIDMAKLIRALNQSDPEGAILGYSELAPSEIPLIAVPTTAGTGSEATQFAVIYVGGKKFSLDHPSLMPQTAIIDTRLTLSLPRSVTAATGLDALCQAIESLWAVAATDESVEYAAIAVELILKQLPVATKCPDPVSREAMCRASYLAGQAINITRTTACHAISYSLTSKYGIPHGFAVSVTLAPLLAYNAGLSAADCQDPRGPDHVLKRIRRILSLLNVTSVSQGVDRILSFLSELGGPVTIRDAGVDTSQKLMELIADTNPQRLSNNPRRATPESLWELLSVSL